MSEKKIENNIQNDVGVEKVRGEFDDGRLNIDGASLKEVLEAPSSKKMKLLQKCKLVIL